MSGEIVLYGCLVCPYVQRVRFALEEMQIPYRYEEIDLAVDANNKE